MAKPTKPAPITHLQLTRDCLVAGEHYYEGAAFSVDDGNITQEDADQLVRLNRAVVLKADEYKPAVKAYDKFLADKAAEDERSKAERDYVANAVREAEAKARAELAAKK